MTNEEKILEILSVMQKDISGLKEDVSGLKEDVSGLKEDVSGLKEDVSGLKEEQQNTNKRLDNLETQLNENTQIVKAIRHNQEFANAKMESIEITTAKADALVKLDSKVEVLNTRLFDQEAEIRTLKVVNK